VRGRYRLQPRAIRDLDDQADYLAAEAGLETAISFLESAHNTFARLSQQPQAEWRHRFKHGLLRGVRVFRLIEFDKFLVFYRPEAEGIRILRVIHGSQDIDALFAKPRALD
jgi:toxin ParE1/3/4